MHLKIVKSHLPEKKFDAIFSEEGKPTHIVSFGSSRYQDFTQHKDLHRRTLYINRHKKNEDWNDPMSAGALSRFILWGSSTNMNENIATYKKKFGYN